MQLYWRLKRLFAGYLEISKELGPRPLINIRWVDRELIIEIPYGYVIITFAGKLRSEHPVYTGRSKQGMSKHEKRDRRFSNTPAGITKN